MHHTDPEPHHSNIETPATPRDEGRGKSKIENIQALRGVAILFVVLAHIGVYEERIYPSQGLIDPIGFFGRSGVDLFFVISGFVMVTITQGRSHGYKSAGTFFLRRAARIYPLYWFYTLLYLPIFLFFSSMMHRTGKASGINLIDSFLLLPGPVGPLVGQAWTLIHEVYFYFVFALILLKPEKVRPYLLGLWALIIVIFAFMSAELLSQSPTLELVFNPLTLEFLAGCGIAWALSRGVDRHSVMALSAGTAVLVVASFLHGQWHSVILYLVPYSLLVYGAAAVEVRSHYQFPRWLRFIGNISYSLYLSHNLVLSALIIVFAKLTVYSGIVSNLIFNSVALAVTVTVGIMSYYWIEKPLLKWAYAIVQGFSSRPSRRK